MFPANATEIELLILFIVPGFVASRAYRLFITEKAKPEFRLLLEWLTGSVLVFGPSLLVVRASFANIDAQPKTAATWLFVELLALPAVLGAAAGMLMRLDLVAKLLARVGVIHPTPTAWDYYFGKREPCYVLITLEDGHRVGGLWHEKSFASSDPDERDIYLEITWQVNSRGEFDKPIQGTKGILVPGSRIRQVEFFEIPKPQEQEEVSPDGGQGERSQIEAHK